MTFEEAFIKAVETGKAIRLAGWRDGRAVVASGDSQLSAILISLSGGNPYSPTVHAVRSSAWELAE